MYQKPPMNRLDRYILREALPIFGFGLALYVGLALLSNLLPRAQWLGTANLGGLLKFLALQIPWAVSLALPMGALLAVLLTYGRLSRENELLVMQAGGISIRRTAKIFLLGGIMLTVLSLVLSEWVIPWANRAQVLVYWNELVPERTAAFRLAGQDLAIGPYRLRFEGYDKARDELKQVRLESWQDQTIQVVLADSATFQQDRVMFKDYKVYTLDLAQLPLPDYASLEEAELGLRKFFKGQVIGQPGQTLTIRLSQSRQDLEAKYAGGFESYAPLSDWWNKLRNPQTPPKERLEARAQWHSGVALSFANLLILLLAIPVAVRRASSFGTALALALVLTLAYYVLFTTGKTVALAGTFPPEIAAWAANGLALAMAWGLGRNVYR